MNNNISLEVYIYNSLKAENANYTQSSFIQFLFYFMKTLLSMENVNKKGGFQMENTPSKF